MTDTFTASNGIEITRDPDREGKVYLVGRRARGDEGQYLGTHATASTEGIVALREFFQHERDEEQGVWRSSKDHTWTAVRRNNTIYFQNGDHERSFWFIVGNDATLKPWPGALQAIAREYLQAHPERKPWQDAQQNELWELQISGCHDPEIYRFAQDTTCADSRVYRPVNNPKRVFFHPDSSLIAAGRRIWPEDAS